MKNFFKTRIVSLFGIIALIAVIGISMAACDLFGDEEKSYSYVITGSGSSFTAMSDGKTVSSGNMTKILDDIRTNAGGNNVSIQFGNGTNTLSFGSLTNYVIFQGSWGQITLSGKVEGVGLATSPVLRFQDNVVVFSSADISQNAGGTAVRLAGNSKLTVTSGTISVTSGTAIQSGYTADAHSGELNISGGTVQSTAASGNAIAVQNGGKVTLSGNATITSENTSLSPYQGTIYLQSKAEGVSDPVLTIGPGVTITNANSRPEIGNSNNLVIVDNRE